MLNVLLWLMDGCGTKNESSDLSGKSTSDVVRVVEGLDDYYDSLYFFLSGCYSKDHGGFYESWEQSGVPKLESTARAITMFQRAEALDDLPAHIKADMIGYLQAMQDPETGFFEDMQENRDIHQRRGRALGYCVGALKKLDASPKYPLPDAKSGTGVDHIQSSEAFVKWMESLDWDQPWKVGGAISSQRTLIEQLPDERQKKLLYAAFDWLENTQDPNTGWWGNDKPYYQLSGAFKLGLLYKAFDRRMPREDLIYSSILKTVGEEKSHDGCWVRNTLHLLEVIRPGFEGISNNDRELLVTKLSENIIKLRRPDGGFARHEGQTFGVTDGCSQAMKTRDSLRKLAGLPEKPFPNPELFWIFK